MARVARQKGGVAYLQPFSTRRASPRSSQLTRTRPPPSASLRCAATSPLRGGGLLLPWRGELGRRGGGREGEAWRLRSAVGREPSHQQGPRELRPPPHRRLRFDRPPPAPSGVG